MGIRLLLISATSLLAISLLFALIAIFSPSIYVSNGDATRGSKIGFFRGELCSFDMCSAYVQQLCSQRFEDGSPFPDSDTSGSDCDRIRTYQAFAIIAILSFAISVISLVGAMLLSNNAPAELWLKFRLSPLFASLGGFAGAITMAVFLGKDGKPTGFDFGFAFALFVVSWLLALIGGVLLLVARTKPEVTQRL